MSLPILQIAAIVAVAIYLVRWRAGLRRRNALSWDSLVTRLQPGWSARDLSVHFLSKEGLNTTPEETWVRMRGFIFITFRRDCRQVFFSSTNSPVGSPPNRSNPKIG